MTVEELVPELERLSRPEKLQIIKFLVESLESEELSDHVIYTPYGNDQAAKILYDLLYTGRD